MTKNEKDPNTWTAGEIRKYRDEYGEIPPGLTPLSDKPGMFQDLFKLADAASKPAELPHNEVRINGQWRRGSLGEDLHLNSALKKATVQAGFVLDTLGRDALAKVRDGETSLNAAYEYALAKRDEEARAA